MMGNSIGNGTTSNHKRSHSFNNHQSYTQHLTQQQQNQQKYSQQNGRLQSSCDAISPSSSSHQQSSSRLTGTSKMLSAFEFAEIFNANSKFEGIDNSFSIVN